MIAINFTITNSKTEKPWTVTELAQLLTRPRTTTFKEVFLIQTQKGTSLSIAVQNILQENTILSFQKVKNDQLVKVVLALTASLHVRVLIQCVGKKPGFAHGPSNIRIY